MEKDEKYAWLDRCSGCKEYKPKNAKAKCPIPPALRADDPLVINNIGRFADDYGICKQYNPMD